MHARLVPLDGSNPIDIVKDLTLVGRKEDCDLRLEHKSVSKMHCVIVKTDGMLMLRDLGSTNGTRVNGQRVRRAILLPDDQLHIASYKFRIHLGAEPPPALRSDEHTQQLDPGEVADLLRQAKQGTLESSQDDIPARPMQPKALPDIYPEDQQKP
jgi:pSer/pThr/pTyr-binding forkhead associated (FHA) protein